jgi:hypothetical protein
VEAVEVAQEEAAEEAEQLAQTNKWYLLEEM